MTQFWRNGFWRISASGLEHWVEGHEVNRDDWHRESGIRWDTDSRFFYRGLLEKARAIHSASARDLHPNADCPVCGQPVFFYQNHFGSRVFFDELGPPWPKHPCTDSTSLPLDKGLNNVSVEVKQVSPSFRKDFEIRLLGEQIDFAREDPESIFGLKYGTGRWTAWSVRGRLSKGGSTYFVLGGVGSKAGLRKILVAENRTPDCICSGAAVFLHRNWLSIFDLHKMAAIDIELRIISNSRKLIDLLFEIALPPTQEDGA